jgi:CHASE2 domain-containing sensor protein
MKKISIKGVLIGSIVDIVLSTLLAFPLSLYAISKVDFAHTPKDQIHAVTSGAIQKNVPLQTVEVLIGMGCSVLAGYVAASIAKRNELLNGALSSILCVALGVLSICSGLAASYPLIVQIALLIASPVSGLLGGYLKLFRKRALIPL